MVWALLASSAAWVAYAASQNNALATLGVGTLVASSSLPVDALVGFVFAIPRSIQERAEIKQIGDGVFGKAGGPLELIVNANLSINHEPDSALDQKKIRDYGANLSLAWTAPNRLTGRLPGNSEFSTIALSFSGEFRRLADIGENMGSAQPKIDLPSRAASSFRCRSLTRRAPRRAAKTISRSA